MPQLRYYIIGVSFTRYCLCVEHRPHSRGLPCAASTQYARYSRTASRGSILESDTQFFAPCSLLFWPAPAPPLQAAAWVRQHKLRKSYTEDEAIGFLPFLPEQWLFFDERSRSRDLALHAQLGFYTQFWTPGGGLFMPALCVCAATSTHRAPIFSRTLQFCQPASQAFPSPRAGTTRSKLTTWRLSSRVYNIKGAAGWTLSAT
ncbi:hypothetical protein IQ07DRAFT_79306 [Pyrenochaeta sp. DS3sAY3a]|nr:hypothetical protein IQ07DRAFT_79306 [Pyrenochaeta sp. DS3sAY3a]